ncbi:hypothetical protein CMO95_00600 [Candidatus Woesearchaeota archaeon]|nr:hypothetical protein [Candidatus Woesearchaeota archaeon]
MQGKDFKLYSGSVGGSGTLIAKGTTLGFSSTNTPIDITNKDSGGNREMLAGGTTTKSVSLSGIFVGDASQELLETKHNAKSLDDYYIEYPLEGSHSNNRTDAFSGYVSDFELTGEVEGSLTFSATLQVSGAVTSTAGS